MRKNINNKEAMTTTGNEKAEWCYTCLWMMRYDYELNNSLLKLSLDAIIDRLTFRWPDEKVPERKWFEGVIKEENFRKLVDMDVQDYISKCVE